jgi:succinate dehydrogenase/fumarate reductase cytochrome b subunit
VGLLVVVVFHGLNGLRNILNEWRPSKRLDAALVLVGITTVLWGLDILWAFWYHRPFFSL